MININNRDHVYYFELDKDFNVNIFQYFINDSINRPIPEFNVITEFEKMVLKGKALAGIPGHNAGNITFKQYKNALEKSKNELNKIKFHAMRNVEGQYVTKQIEKHALLNCCFKRYFLNKNISYSFGHNKIKNSINLVYDESDSSDISTSSFESPFENSDLEQSDSNLDEQINENAVDIFVNRIDKYKNLIFSNNNTGIEYSNQLTSHIDSIENPLPSCSGVNTNTILNSDIKSSNSDSNNSLNNGILSRRRVFKKTRKIRKINVITTSSSDSLSSSNENINAYSPVKKSSKTYNQIKKNIFINLEAERVSTSNSCKESSNSSNNSCDNHYDSDDSFINNYSEESIQSDYICYLQGLNK